MLGGLDMAAITLPGTLAGLFFRAVSDCISTVISPTQFICGYHTNHKTNSGISLISINKFVFVMKIWGFL
jgi:hypothetical protein